MKYLTLKGSRHYNYRTFPQVYIQRTESFALQMHHSPSSSLYEKPHQHRTTSQAVKNAETESGELRLDSRLDHFNNNLTGAGIKCRAAAPATASGNFS